MAFVYIHTNQETGKVYVGQTWQNPSARWATQRNSAIRGAAGCRYLYAAIRKHGWNSFDHQIVAETENQAKLDNLEKVWIILLRADNPKTGYNLKAGGGAGRPSAITCRRMSLAAKRRQRSPLSETTKAKISAAQKGISKPASETTRMNRKNNPRVIAHCRALGEKLKNSSWSDMRRATQEKRKGVSAWNHGLKTGKPAWNRGLSMPSVSEKMMGNTNGRFSWKNRKSEVPNHV